MLEPRKKISRTNLNITEILFIVQLEALALYKSVRLSGEIGVRAAEPYSVRLYDLRLRLRTDPGIS